MVPTIDVDSTPQGSTEQFYDGLAPEYDRMTGFAQRFVQERPFFRLLLDRYEIRKAVDAGCGTGFHSLLLAELGANVIGVDVSTHMLERLQHHAQEMNLTVTPVRAGLHELGEKLPPDQDAVFCLGNTLAHLLTPRDLSAAIAAFSKVLTPGGMLFLQTLNYEKILAARELVQNIRDQDNVVFLRLYEYGPTFITFHILRLERTQTGLHHSVRSVRVRPLLEQELVAAVQTAAFEDIRLFGSIRLDEFKPHESRDLVVMARRPR